MQSTARIPCTIITGFLGSGKTTIVRNLIENAKGRRFAIIVNEFGDIGIDGEILRGCGVENCSEDDVVELANGCICCTVADDFEPALDAILKREPAVDHILIETSGLALPKPLVQAFNWPAIRSRVTVDGVITVADGAALAGGQVAADMDALSAQRLADESVDHDDPIEEVFDDQIACADLVILSKTDLLSDKERERVEARLQGELTRPIRIVPSRNGALDPAILLGLDAATEDSIDAIHTHHDADHENGHDHDHDEFESFIVDLPPISSPEELTARVEAACAIPDVLRVKGFAAVSDKPMRLVVQAVGSRVQSHFDRPWKADEKRGTRLVVIGLHDLDATAVRNALAA
ncbi:cobalamin biosynthesis protein CobW [Notoacmeibacter sp. MSK16QG-6]|uniref:cobalamin biosynthesis protein CobW n=1 Tax=Notoacmeibacter sp. MSK16QG-6 TaxID=2957982 RepID=UPI00209E45E3|nr:cobalamin biosynthesis protein CobW [Notoacmeibacter sp. MSK16QG-6]MCP1199785.1 cobalamin biosynthesis protein CobW [Notoacmeibacter sp. MSK16QG-6]